MAYNPGGGGQPPFNQQYPYNAPPPSAPPPPKGGMGTGAKVALFGCLGLLVVCIVAAIVIGVVYVAMSKNANSVTPRNVNSSSSNSSSSNSSSSNSSSSNSSVDNSSSSDVHVASIQLARDSNGSAGEDVDSFAPADNPMHAVVRLSSKTAGTKVRVVLIAVSAATGDKNTKVAEIERETGVLQDELDTTFTLPRDWPVGDYRVDVFVNGKLDKSLTFRVDE